MKGVQGENSKNVYILIREEQKKLEINNKAKRQKQKHYTIH